MSEEDLKLRIQTIHKNLLGSHLDQKALRFWVHAVSNDQEKINEFTSMLLHSNEYRQLLFKRYREIYIDLVGFDIKDDEFNLLYESIKGSAVDLPQVKRYIMQLPSAIQKYTDLIRSTFALRKCTEVPIDVLAYYLDRFLMEDQFDLAAAIDRNDHLPKEISAKLYDNDSVELMMDLLGAKTMHDAIDALRTLQVAVATLPHAKEQVSMRTDQIVMFERVFNRQMYVQEYFKYVSNESSLKDDQLVSLFTSTQETYFKVREIYEAFMCKEISEYEFIKQFLYDYESPDFFVHLVDKIIESDGYATSMKLTLFKLYSEMYDEHLETTDIDYIFNRIKSKKLPVVSEELREELTELKKETDSIISNLFEKFTQVLERQPDIYEVDEMLQFYRSNLVMGVDKLNLYLEKRLVSSMEFHDIIKHKIKTSFKKDPLPSQMFSLLKKVLEQITNDTDLTECDQIIKSVCMSQS